MPSEGMVQQKNPPLPLRTSSFVISYSYPTRYWCGLFEIPLMLSDFADDPLKEYNTGHLYIQFLYAHHVSVKNSDVVVISLKEIP